MTTLADRNNNPGNIRDTSIPWQGAVGTNAGFETFATPEHGVRATTKNLYTYNERDGLNTVGGIITKWAPPGENNTPAYIDKVSNDLGVGPNDDLGYLRDNDTTTKALVQSITEMEGGSTGPAGKYNNQVLENGIAMAKGKPESEIEFSEQPTNFDGEQFGAQVDVEQGFTNDTTTVVESAEIKKLTKDEIAMDSITPNWLSTVDSPTYRWTLYIVNNDIWNNPNLIGNDDAVLNNSQAFIIAKQGVTTEFSLDNFLSLATVTPGQRHGNTTPGVVQFDLFENLGFSFLDKVLIAGKKLGKPASLYSQNFVLKLEFIGRDPTTAASIPFNGVFLYPVKLNQIRSTTGPEGTRYNIVAWSALKHAQTETVLDTDITIKDIKTVLDFAINFEKEFNDAQFDAIGPRARQNGITPPKQIKIVFDSSTSQRPGAETKVNGKPLDWFDLPSKPFAGTADPSTSNKTGSTIYNSDTNTLTAERETNTGMWIQKVIENNCSAWSAWVDEANKYGLTPHIAVEPDYQYPPQSMEYYIQKEMIGNVEPVVITYTIKIGYGDTVYPPSIDEGNKNLNNPQHQADRFKTLPIEKSYTYLYSGLNTEVLNYQIDVNNLFFVLDQPGAATFVAGKDADGHQQFSPAEITDSLFLSDLKQSSVDTSYFNPVVGGVAKTDSGEHAQVTEYLAEDSSIARRLQDMAKREFDAINFNMEIKGDPHWMGNMQAVVQGKLELKDYAKQDALITFLQFNPNADKLLEEQTKGEIDPISTGVYKLVTIESRFQGGRFTQTLNGYKDINSNTALLLPKIIEISGV